MQAEVPHSSTQQYTATTDPRSSSNASRMSTDPLSCGEEGCHLIADVLFSFTQSLSTTHSRRTTRLAAMPALYGYKQEWAEFPDWPARYDFVVKQPPSSTAVQDHIARADGRLSLVARYLTVPPVKTGWADFRRSFRPPPVFFTTFGWRDSENNEKTCSREELCAGFRTLVAGYQELYALACALYTVWDLVPFVNAEGAPRTPTTEEQMNLERTYYPQVMRAATAWQEIRFKLYWEADYMAQYLAYLSDLEDAGKLPAVFRAYPRGVTEKSVDRLFDGERVCMFMGRDRMDDFPFQMLSVIESRRKGEHWHTMKRLLEELLVPILDCKGYNGEQEVKKLYPATGAFRPPSSKE